MKPKISWQFAIILIYFVGLIVFTFTQSILGGFALTGLIGSLVASLSWNRQAFDNTK